MPTDPVVTIGSRCLIGRGSHIVGHWEIVMGDDIQTGPYVYITDQNHVYEDLETPIGRQWPTEAPVRIGSGSWLGANAVVLPGAQIGEHVVVAAGRSFAASCPTAAWWRGSRPASCDAGSPGVAGSPSGTWRRRDRGRGRRRGAGGNGTSPHLIAVRGQDAPGIAHRLFVALDACQVEVDDVEQVRVHGRLLLCVEAALDPDGAAATRRTLEEHLAECGVEVAVDPLREDEPHATGEQYLVTVLAPEIDAETLAGVTAGIASCGGNIERIVRLAAYPVHSYELAVAGRTSNAFGGCWPRRRHAAASTWRCSRRVCTEGPST